MNGWRRRGAAAAAAVLVAAFTASPAAAAYSDREAITSHVALAVPQALAVTRPAGDTHVDAANFYLTGTSSPDVPLTLDGQEVAGRGVFGSWGVYVPLAMGENLFTLQNGGDSQTVRIVRGPGGEAATTATLTGMTPQYDVALPAGDTIYLTCTAPAGAQVTVELGGQRVALRQKAAASGGVPATFSGEMDVPALSGIQNLGQATYTLRWDGRESTHPSQGSLIAVGEGETLLVRMKDTSSTVFEEESRTSGFVATAKAGAVDYVAEFGGTMYKLGMGGWVLHEAAQPLLEGGGYKNMVSDVSFSADGREERFVFSGTASPLFTAYQDSERLYLKLFHTSGITSVPVQDSALFSGVRVEKGGGATALTFQRGGGESLWGYAVEYQDGNTILTCRYRPRLSPGAQPLRGITVALDPGHGGTDTGALGVAAAQGPAEKDINLATALAVKKRLEGLGATVLLTRQADEAVGFNGRMQPPQDARADFFVSLHCNAVGAGADGKPQGNEIYYYEDISAPFAATLLRRVVDETGRTNRGAKYSNFKVTLNTYAPSVLVEMGFATNPAQYDELCSRQGIFNMANAIGDGIVEYLS